MNNAQPRTTPDDMRQFSTIEQIWDALDVGTKFYQIYACHGTTKVEPCVVTWKGLHDFGNMQAKKFEAFTTTRHGNDGVDMVKINVFLDDQQNYDGKAIFTNRQMAERYLNAWFQHMSGVKS